MSKSEPKQDIEWVWITLTWLFSALLVGALALFAFSSNNRGIERGSSVKRVASTSHEQLQDHLRSAEVTVLTFNVAGLPWPVSNGRAQIMPEIGRQIAALSAEGTPVDVVLIQEGFISETDLIADSLGFPHRISGAGANLMADAHPCTGCAVDNRQQKWWKGEGIGSLAGSGLHIYSVHPIFGVNRMAFGDNACAGYDCLANKGAVVARIAFPGVPQPIDILTTHLNSTNAAGVPKWETHIAHQHQVRRLANFWDSVTTRDRPAIMGGDFNIRGSHQRFLPMARLFSDTTFVKNTCDDFGGETLCDIEIRPDAPWLTSQDLQAYKSGDSVRVSPVLAKTVLNKPVNGVALSDHFGFLVTYRLSW